MLFLFLWKRIKWVFRFGKSFSLNSGISVCKPCSKSFFKAYISSFYPHFDMESISLSPHSTLINLLVAGSAIKTNLTDFIGSFFALRQQTFSLICIAMLKLWGILSRYLSKLLIVPTCQTKNPIFSFFVHATRLNWAISRFFLIVGSKIDVFTQHELVKIWSHWRSMQ